ncbi:histone H1-like [Centroberyx affinis]|uniref:histone H1-like n=1 Tax=Centroberyx affinis TaxID=166261 RepID=UPI003A5BC65A
MPRRPNKKTEQGGGRKKLTVGPKRTRTTAAKGNINVKSRKNTPRKPVKQVRRPAKSPGGKGLGKAGARRLGQLLKPTMMELETFTGNRKVPLPKTPLHPFKYQTQAEAANAPKTHGAKKGSVSHLILSLVSQCKHRGGISMAELKQALAAGGYDITKNNRRVILATKGLVRKETLVQTRGTGTFKLNKTKLTDEKQVRTTALKSSKPKGAGLKAGNPASKSPKAAGKPLRTTRKSPKQAGKSPKPGGELSKPTGKTAKPGRKLPKPAGKKPKPATKRAAQDGKAARKARGDEPKQNVCALKSPQKR